MKWMLILIVTINPNWDGRGGSSVTVQQVPFITQQACERALQQARQIDGKEHNGTNTVHVYGFCAEDQ